MNYLHIDKNFIKNFLNPISNVSEKGIINVDKNKVSSSVATPDGMIILYIINELHTESSTFNLNIGDISKLKNLLDGATDLDENNKIEISDTLLKYKSKKWRFKYHLLDDGIIKPISINVQKIKDFQANTSFELSMKSILEIVKLRALNKESDKIYFRFQEEVGVTATVTDYSITNTDEMSVLVTDTYEGDSNILGCPVYFEMIKILSQHRNIEKFRVKYNGNAFLFQAIHENVMLNYIVSEIKN